jgi:predicted ATPase/KaiC/GvpD/RAD55 family RecA-like ATPase
LASLERDRVPLARAISVREVPLVDRAEEMNALKETLYNAVHGEGGLVFVHGEAGIGKTRLLRELGAYAQSRGVQVLYGRCPGLFRMDSVPPYAIWKEVIKDYLETCLPEQLYRVVGYYPAEVAKLVPEISLKLRTIPPSFPISPEHEQNRLFEAISQFITNISQETPLIVVLDDLQWTDPSSLLLLHYLARGVQKAQIFLLGAYRSTDVDTKHPLTPVLTELNRERLPQSISLKRMSLSDISEMIRNILEQEDIPDEFCRMVYEKTRGNPFFAEEVIKSLKEEEVIYREDNTWKFKEISAIEFPETVKNVLKTRLNRLDEECQNVLTWASFIGNDFTCEALCEVSGIEENKLLELIEKLLKTGLVKHKVIRGEDVCSFADILVRDVVYEEVSPFRRKKLHNIIGYALEKVYAKKIDEHFGEIALHFLESGDKDKALDYFLKAGEKAAKIYANNEALSYFQHAFGLLEEKEDRIQEKGRILEKLGDIKKLIGENDASLKNWNNALLLWEQMQEKENISRLHRKMAHILWDRKGDVEKAKEHFDRAHEILETEPESRELARVYNDMAHMYWRIGEENNARSWGEKALEFAKKVNDNEIIASSCLDLGSTFDMIGDRKKAIELEKMALEIALDNEYMEIAERAYNNLAVALREGEEIGEGVKCYEKGYELAKKIGDMTLESWLASNLGETYENMGDMSKAISLHEESVAIDRKTGDPTHLSMSLCGLGRAYMILGEWDKSEKYLIEALNIANGLKDFQAIGYAYMALADFYHETIGAAKALELLNKGNEATKEIGVKSMRYLFSYWITDNFIELGEIEKAQSQIKQVYEYALEVKAQYKEPLAYADRLKAMLFRAQKKWDQSIDYFEKTLKEFERLNARRWNVYNLARWVLYEYALTYMERDQPGDKEKARNLLNQALEIYQKIGAKKDIEKVEAKIDFIETGKQAPEPKLIDYISTGYADLDKLLHGGIPPNCAVVLTSPSCNERDMLIKSFLKTGAKNGEVTFYVTIDASAARALAEESMSNLQLFVCNPEADAIIKNSPNVQTLKGVENLTDISIALTSAIRKLDPSLKGPRRICIDLVSDVLLQHHAIETRRWLTALMTKLKSEGFTTLAVIDPQIHPSTEFHAIVGLFDGEIDISEKETEKGLERFLKIKKMSNQEYVKDELLLTKRKGE